MLTGRRLVSLTSEGADESTTIVDSTHLDRLSGVTVTHRTTPEFDQGNPVAGLSLALLGTADGGLAILLLATGASVGGMGIVLLIEAYNTPDGSVRIVLRTNAESVAWQARLDEDYRSFAETLSKTVSTVHAPATDVTRTVGT